MDVKEFISHLFLIQGDPKTEIISLDFYSKGCHFEKYKSIQSKFTSFSPSCWSEEEEEEAVIGWSPSSLPSSSSFLPPSSSSSWSSLGGGMKNGNLP